ASERVVGNAGSPESFTEQNQNDAAGSLAARVYASDSAAASAPSAGSLYLDENLASTKQEKLDAYAAKVLHEKSRMLSLGMGWIELKNDLIPTASTVSLPPEVNEIFQWSPSSFRTILHCSCLLKKQHANLSMQLKEMKESYLSSPSGGSVMPPSMISGANLR